MDYTRSGDQEKQAFSVVSDSKKVICFLYQIGLILVGNVIAKRMRSLPPASH